MGDQHTMADGLEPNAANHVPLSPVSFIARAEKVYGTRTAIIHGARAYTYREFAARCRRLASALRQHGVRAGDTVAIIAPNTPEMLEAHFGVPLAGGVLNAINIRLEAETIAFILRHGRARVLLVDREFSGVVARALDALEEKPLVVDIDDPEGPGGAPLAELDYERFLAGGDPDYPMALPEDEWQPVALNYTSGTTGNPKGALCHHRGAYLNACGNAFTLRLTPESVYLWTLPMFHCNGWTHTWAVTMAGGTHVCLRRVEPRRIFELIPACGVNVMAAAPIVLNTLIHTPEEEQTTFPQEVHVATGGAAPPSTVIGRLERLGFRVMHLYGMTETYGPSMACFPQPGLDDLPVEEKAAFMARQGVHHPMVEDATVLNPDTMKPVPPDGEIMGELVVRGNTVMKGYLDNPAATEEAFAGGWFHTGDLAVIHPDGYIEIKDRAKDIIISGGENISSLEVEEMLYRHPHVHEAAVVAQPHPKWGETPHAFIALEPGAEGEIAAEDIINWCRDHLAGFKCPRYVTFGPLPKTATGKIQKFVLRDRVRKH